GIGNAFLGPLSIAAGVTELMTAHAEKDQADKTIGYLRGGSSVLGGMSSVGGAAAASMGGAGSMAGARAVAGPALGGLGTGLMAGQLANHHVDQVSAGQGKFGKDASGRNRTAVDAASDDGVALMERLGGGTLGHVAGAGLAMGKGILNTFDSV